MKYILTFIILCACSTISHAQSTDPFAHIGDRVNAQIKEGIAITQGVIRVRRRHENDMDFAKYNPFYWEGRVVTFRIDDHTPNGENKIVFSLFTEWPLDYIPTRGPDCSVFFIGDPLAHESLRSKFAINARMKHIKDYKHFQYTLTGAQFNQYKKQLTPGNVVTMELRTFHNATHPDFIKQKKRNVHGLSSYYSEFIRFRVGTPGVIIDNFQSPNTLPSPDRYTGGWTTIPTVRVEPWRAIQQQAFNLTPKNATPFLVGRTWFHTDFKTGKHINDHSDDKPSVFFEETEHARKDYTASIYNVTACNTCHVQNGTSLLPHIAKTHPPIHTTVVKTYHPKSGKPHPQLGNQLQTDGPDAEGSLIIEQFETKQVKLDDGTIVTLSKPIFKVLDASGITPALSPRRTPAIIGMGLLDAVPDQTIINLAKNSKGKPNLINNKVHRFGWKAAQPTLMAQIKDALLNDMGILSDNNAKLDSPNNITAGKGILPQKALDELELYVALLGTPPRTHPTDPTVIQGQKLFNQLNCQSCHTPTLRTGKSHHAELSNQTIHPYTDLLLHDLGPGLADNTPAPDAKLWRTAPLWGLKNTRHATNAHRKQFPPADTNITYPETQKVANQNPVQLLHDGRARSITEAILWHAGEAEPSIEKYKALNKQERQALEAFLWDL